nr:DUF1016 N-terminal domain-containing protein [uncultured Gardnerella sp.]
MHINFGVEENPPPKCYTFCNISRVKESKYLKGFTRRGLYRMKQFYEIYKDDEKVSTLLTQLSWSNHLGYEPKVCKAKLMNILWHKLASALLLTQSTN